CRFFSGLLGAVVAEVERARGVFFKQVGDLFIDRGVVVHLLFQGFVLRAHVPEEQRRVAQQFGCELDISCHNQIPLNKKAGKASRTFKKASTAFWYGHGKVYAFMEFSGPPRAARKKGKLSPPPVA